MTLNVVSYYELSKAFRSSIERDRSGEVSYTVVNRLPDRSVRGILRQFRKLNRQSIVIAVEDENSRQLTGPLILLAAITGSRQIEVLWPDRTRETIPRARALNWAVRIVGAQVSSRWAYLKAKWILKKINSGQREAPKKPVPDTDRILYLDANLPIGSAVGGSVGHTRGVIDGLVENGFRVDYASGKAIPTDSPSARWLAIPKNDFLAFPPEFNCYGFNETFDRAVDGFFANESYAFIYQRMSVHNFAGARLRRTSGIPLVLEYNGSEAWASANWNRKLRLHDMAVEAELASLAQADIVVTVSDVLAEEVAAAGVDRRRIVVYPNCIDPRIFDPGRFDAEQSLRLRAQMGVDADARVATFIGTFGAWHGVEFLARAIHKLVDDDRAWLIANKLHFVLIGDGLKMAEVQGLLGAEPYADFVTLTGAVPQSSAPAYLAASDIFLCPHVPNSDGSTFFGSPTKLFEYMVMERPIVASNLAQIGEVLRGAYSRGAGASDSPLAELFEPGDEAGFLTALRKVVENPDKATVMAKNARAAALGTFTWKHHVNAILSRARQYDILKA